MLKCGLWKILKFPTSWVNTQMHHLPLLCLALLVLHWVGRLHCTVELAELPTS